MTITDQLRAAVEKSGQTRYAIAQATEIEQASLLRFMDGTSKLSGENIDRLCEHLGLGLKSVARGRRK